MKTFKLTLVLLLIATVTFAQKSPRKQANGKIGTVAVEVDYGAPSVRDRIIWGGLEKYGKVWRAGANENTTISFSEDVTIGKNSVPAGKYGLFIIPREEGAWSLILSTKNDAWGSNGYSADNDLFRMNIKPKIEDKNIEQLSYMVYKKGVQFAWEKVRIWIPVK